MAHDPTCTVKQAHSDDGCNGQRARDITDAVETQLDELRYKTTDFYESMLYEDEDIAAMKERIVRYEAIMADLTA